MLISNLSKHGSYGIEALKRVEHFWEDPQAPDQPYELLRYCISMGFFPFAGYLFLYAIVGKIWNLSPFVQTTLPVTRAFMCAGLQWFFFATFPVMSTLILDFFFVRRCVVSDVNSRAVVSAYSLAPVCLAALFVGVPFFGRIIAVLALATSCYLLYFGYRIYLKQTILCSAAATLAVAALFVSIRQMFVFVIGF